MISSSKSSVSSPVGREVQEQRRDVARVELARVRGHRASAGSCRPTIVTPVAHDLLARLGQLAVAAGLRGEVDDHRAGPHRLDRGRPGSASAPARPGTSAVVITHVEVGDPLLERLLLPALLLLRSARARSRPRSPRRWTPRSRNVAPRLSTCSFTAGRTSKPETTAPSRRAVAIACRPATPAPSTSTLAGATVPAAVISIGKNRGSRSAAMQRGLVAGDGACDDSASIGCARVIRGIDSIANATTPRAGQPLDALAVGQRLEEGDQDEPLPQRVDSAASASAP